MKKAHTYSFEITQLNPAGKGLSWENGAETLISHALLGQQVEARVFKKKRGKAEARLQSVLRPRADEITAFCSHFGQPPTESGQGCGGCQWQQVPYNTQLQFKQQMLEQLLSPLLSGVPLKPILASPLEREYRNKVEFSFGDKTFISDTDYLALRAAGQPLPQGFYLGFHMPGSFGTVIDIQACYLISPAARKVYQALHSLLPQLGAEAYSPRHHTGYWRHLIIRQGFRTGDLMVHFNTTDSFQPNWQEVLDCLNKLELGNCQIRSVLHSEHTSDAQIVGFSPPKLLQGEPIIEEQLCDLHFEISAYAFFQTNTLAAEQLYGVVARMANLEQHPVIYDLYSGTGTIGMVLARQGASRVYGLEEIETAVADARRNALRNQIDNCLFETGKVEAMLPALLAKDPAALAIVDPPRAGLHPKVVQMLNQQRLKQLIYVSCNPAALARDLEALHAYRVLEVQPVDMFPQTGHVETVVKLEALAG